MQCVLFFLIKVMGGSLSPGVSGPPVCPYPLFLTQFLFANVVLHGKHRKESLLPKSRWAGFFSRRWKEWIIQQ